MPRVVHFELPADDPERAVKFYTDAFGRQIQKWEGPMEYRLVSTGAESPPGIDGAIYPRQPEWGAHVNAIDVKGIDAAIAAVEAAGGEITFPRQAVPGRPDHEGAADPPRDAGATSAVGVAHGAAGR